MSSSSSRVGQPIFIGKEDVVRLLKTKDLLVPLEQALASCSLSNQKYDDDKDSTRKDVIQPVRTVVPVEKHNGMLLVMPAYLASLGVSATKLVSFYSGNVDHPAVQGFVILFESKNGTPLAILDAEEISAIRTAAASAVATKHLSNEESKVLAILGSGVQARSHFTAMSVIHSFQEVRVWSRTQSNAQKFAQEVGAVACATAEEAVRGADVICTTTSSATPVVMKAWVKEGAHINAVGACTPDWHEIDPELMRSAIVYCDSKEACLQEAGDIILANCNVYAELGEAIAGKKEALRQHTTVFESVGMAVEDVVAAKLVYDKYMQQQPSH